MLQRILVYSNWTRRLLRRSRPTRQPRPGSPYVILVAVVAGIGRGPAATMLNRTLPAMEGLGDSLGEGFDMTWSPIKPVGAFLNALIGALLSGWCGRR